MPERIKNISLSELVAKAASSTAEITLDDERYIICEININNNTDGFGLVGRCSIDIRLFCLEDKMTYHGTLVFKKYKEGDRYDIIFTNTENQKPAEIKGYVVEAPEQPSLLDFFAAHALSGLLANDDYHNVCEDAYELAKDMAEERKKHENLHD